MGANPPGPLRSRPLHAVKAVILAGGKGRRLAPYTTIFPKPLIPVGDKPILDLIIRQLVRQGFTDITLSVGHLAELLMAYFEDGSRFGVRITYSREDQPLGTAGPLALIPDLNERFLVMNGDILTDLDFKEMVAAHVAGGALASIAVCPRRVEIDLGVIEKDEAGRLTRYIEKPAHDFHASMGIYVLEPEVLRFLKAGERADLPDLMQDLMRNDHAVQCYSFQGYWQDIGRPDDHARAVEALDTYGVERFLKG